MKKSVILLACGLTIAGVSSSVAGDLEAVCLETSAAVTPDRDHAAFCTCMVEKAEAADVVDELIASPENGDTAEEIEAGMSSEALGVVEACKAEVD